MNQKLHRLCAICPGPRPEKWCGYHQLCYSGMARKDISRRWQFHRETFAGRSRTTLCGKQPRVNNRNEGPIFYRTESLSAQ